MLIDDRFLYEDERFSGYEPQGRGKWHEISRSPLDYSYQAEWRENRLERLAEERPELAVIAACVNAMGLRSDCVELSMVRFFLKEFPEEIIEEHRRWMPEIVSAIEDRQTYVELYFAFLMPVVFALDVGYSDLAREIYLKKAEELKRDYFL